MKHLAIVLKITLKQIIGSLPIVLGMFIMLPGILGLFMGSMLNSENQQNFEKVIVQVVDEDNTEVSKELVNIIRGKELSELLEVSNDKKADIVVNIPKGYEAAVENNSTNVVQLNVGQHSRYEKILQDVIDAYHFNLYISKDADISKKFEEINNNKIVDFKDIKSENEAFLSNGHMIDSNIVTGDIVVGFIGMIFAMFLVNSAQVKSLDTFKGADMRLKSMPISKRKLYFYNLCSDGLYILLVVLGYITIFNLICGAFSGNILLVLGGALVASLFTVAVVQFMNEFIPQNVALILTMSLMILSSIGGFAIGDMLNGIPNPFEFIVDMFKATSEPLVFMKIAVKILGVTGLLVIGVFLKFKRNNDKKMRGANS
ncbi:MAG: ABC transporter permease [Sarcina sp.]